MDQIRNERGRFIPGHPSIKKPRTLNMQRTTREALYRFFCEKVDDLPEIFDRLKDRDKARLLVDIAGFFVPRRQHVEVEETETQVRIDYTRLSPSALVEVLALTTTTENGTDNP